MYAIIDVSNRKGNGFNDLTGQRFGRLTVLGLSPKKSGRKSYWVCQCDCGNKHLVRSDSLTSGNVQSCGCLKKEQDKINLTKFHRHKESHTKLHDAWLNMKARCNNKNVCSYPIYGGRGISVCDEWANSYEAFRDWSLDNGFEDNPELSIERIDVNGNYEPSNCEWILWKEQVNNRQNTIWITFNDKTQNLMQWSKELGIQYKTLHERYRRGDRGARLLRPVER